MTLVPFEFAPGYNADDTTFSLPGRWVSGDGFRFRGGRPETVGGASLLSSASNASRVNKMMVYDAGGSIKLAAAGDALTIAAINSAATDITPAANWTANVRHCLAMYGDTILALVAGGRLFESAGGVQATAVTNAPTQSTCMVVTPSRQVMLLGTNEEISGTFNNRCIRWSNIEDITDWTTTATNNAGEYILPGQEDIISATVFGDHIVIWTEGSLWLAQFVGDPGQTFVFTRIDATGICGLDAYTIHQNTLYWVAPGIAFHAWQLGAAVQPIPCPLQKSLLAYVASQAANTFGCTISQFGEVWFGFTAGGTEAPGKYVVLCTDEEGVVWYDGSFATALGASVIVGAMVDSPLLVSAALNTLVLVHVYATTGTRKPWAWDKYQDAIIGAYIQSGDFYIQESQRRVMVRGTRPDFEALDTTNAPAISLTLYFRDYPQGSATTKGPYSLTTATTKKDFRASGKMAAVRLSTADNPFRLGKLLFDVVPLGER